MLNEKGISQITEQLEKAQNPIFFFDNDPDGLCSFLLLQRWLGRGKGVAIKSFPDLNEAYFRKVQELRADYIVILDKPLVSYEFFKKIKEVNLPVMWIDHHDMGIKVPKFVDYYNPTLTTKINEPVTALCYQMTQKKEDLWLAVVGCISDGYMPDFYKEFMEKWPELGVKTTNPFEVFYKSRIGEVARIFSGGLKDTTTNVVNMLRFLVKAKAPCDVLEESSKNYSMHKRFKQIDEKYQRILEKAKALAVSSGKFLFFKYSGDLSVSGELANELMYTFPEKDICVAYVKGGKANLSLRGKNIKEKLLKALEGIEGATGGGHDDAVGGQMHTDDLEKFREKLEKLV
jgi:single-stranded DNA-specific DHH superfamily exonuclease